MGTSCEGVTEVDMGVLDARVSRENNPSGNYDENQYHNFEDTQTLQQLSEECAECTLMGIYTNIHHQYTEAWR